MDSADQSDLIDRIKKHDADALASFIDLHRQQLMGFLNSITGDRLLSVVELDDLVQEVSTAALTGLSTAPLDQYEPMQWIQQIARRRVVDAHRFHFGAQRRDAGRQKSIHADDKQGSSAVGLEQMLAASMTSPSAAFSRDVRMNRMQQAIEELTDEQKSAVRMRYAEGLQTKQIAEKLGKTDVAVRVLLSRSMRQLEKRLEDVKPTRQ
ncbi:RNA polymerase sigma factor [Novipirellula artificiosorum]|uniref:ECF RNA polymerase sigma factor SigD n=1 Tax=Novipirellula artificiosorum TaxID=2528016 RepID=A0A5C6DR14_9BACT|nr:sigma-70 family RNA polymerase sigma factor [Novipirellula artificiosorum]TWU38317.1 ECF RNA polymerase sigma factor SigD [Novipirellula artificiosorum]